MLPELRISIDCDASFRQPARYALATLALIAGHRVRFTASDADLHYGPVPVGGAAWLPASPLAKALTRREPVSVKDQDLSLRDIRFLGLFPVPSFPADSGVDSTAGGVLASDIVAAAFFFLSLHEEWTTERRDQFGRFLAEDSLLGRRGEVDRPVVAEYARVFSAILAAAGLTGDAGPRFAGRRAAAVMTHDIDYLSKFTPGLIFREVVRNFLFNRRHVPFAARRERLGEYLTFRTRDRDPYVISIRRMLEIERERGIVASWLFKAGGSDKRDVTYSLSSSRARDTLAALREAGHDIGLHPSFHAHTDAGMLSREAGRLREAAGTPLRSIRQHYLRFVYPQTWRQQADEGFFVDSTLGFAEQEGFRNGVCHPFLPWDAETSAPLPLWEVPLTVMDGTLAHYRGMPPDAAIDRIGALLDVTAAENGAAVLLFHNTSYDAHDFPGWSAVFERTAERVADGRFMTAPLPAVVEAWLASAGYDSTADFHQVINTEPSE